MSSERRVGGELQRSQLHCSKREIGGDKRNFGSIGGILEPKGVSKRADLKKRGQRKKACPLDVQ